MSCPIPKNYETRNLYQGKNFGTLLESMNDNGFSSPYFMTYRQALGLGLQVIKGSKGTSIDKFGENKNTKRSFARSYSVFNLEQCEEQ